MEEQVKREWNYTNETGSSLFEVVIVIAIISIISYTSITSYQYTTKQRQLTDCVREIIAFLSYQEQQALLFNITIKINLFLSPKNLIRAMPISKQSSSLLIVQPEDFQLVKGIELAQSTVQSFSFGEIRQTLKPMSFVIKNTHSEVKIIISSLGRIRACSRHIRDYPLC